ncbi:hypothetical protein AYK20_05165 [Thermoplasmatales archaeon SG8-52-1]|nr:MAG: hypothetical protein AYK20_05165 [Thermoplasmatales archaeon SG8-52-1]
MHLNNSTEKQVVNYKSYNNHNKYNYYKLGVLMTNTTISITQETKKALLELGKKGETYDSIIRKLIKRFAWKKLDEEWNKIVSNDDFIPLDEL